MTSTKHRKLSLGMACLAVAILSHLFFLTEFFQGRYMTGLNDGLSQMIPFKYFLYNLFTEGELFYSESFGLGGGVFSQLGYYFSTSLVFYVTVLMTFLLEKMGWISSPNLFYWANIILVISILRMTCILALTTYYFRKIRFAVLPAVVAATLYGTCVMYFRHVTYWEFFADAMLFLPLLLIGVESIMRDGKARWFIAAVALNMIDNFYFAYVNFLITGIYIVFRWLFPLFLEETKKGKQIQLFLFGGLAGAGLSAPFFIPSVYGYLNNYRPSFEDAIPLIGPVDNLLLHGRLVILPAFVLLCLFIVPLYKKRAFRFFAVLTITLCILHYSPMVGSLFNGLSAPQYRWEHFLALAAGGVAGGALHHLKLVRWRDVLIAVTASTVLYSLFFFADPKLKIKFYESYLIICAVVTMVILLLYVHRKKRWAFWVTTGFLIFSSLLTANMFQHEKLTYRDNGKNKGPEYGITREYMESEEYYGVDQRKLIRKLQEVEKDPLARIDWMVDTRNNTPIVQDFNGTSVYSSILNKHLLYFYLDDLAIDMRRESVSRYASLGDRANLYAILNGSYVIRKRGEEGLVPFGFKEIAREGEYVAYQNEYRLPFVRTASVLFQEGDLKGTPALSKERAMLQGIVLEDVGQERTAIPEVENLIDQAALEPVGGTYEDGVLVVTEVSGGLDVIINETGLLKEDVFLSFFIQRKKNDKDYMLTVNDFETERKKNDSIYRTNVNELTIRVPAEERIRIRVPKGKYDLRDFALYTEDYAVLREVKKESDVKPKAAVTWNGHHASVKVDNTKGDSHVVLPIPYERGWTAKVNGTKQEILRANYAFTGLELDDGMNEIELTYYPPFFAASWAVAGFTAILLVGIVYWRRKGMR
ncbi:YfhO family protein [Sporosarcina sp. Te-1]|uniref:YfhO family protein n=1 Tax=Sporosarcina sp. Te-1 TaxID=2818390 RepID=UPI001A9FD244|nr:YfhO family protein [Sporosarcina sp. Te-1]QTD39716.1 YfhO family protein [Sporosarcina sp. Te-1]